MGCKESKQDGLGNGPEGSTDTSEKGGSSLPKLDISGLDGPTKYEQLMPFSKTKIEEFETKVKMASGDSKDISLEQLRKTFSDNKLWSDSLQKPDSSLIKAFENALFKSEENAEMFNRDVLILWALMLCGGDAKVKTRILYDVL